MPNAILIIIQPDENPREVEVSGDVVSIGRALDNTICIEGDTNVSRYHAEIVARDGGFWVTDLGSSNGTTVNDEPVEFERKLQDGDVINVGGASTIEFYLREVQSQSREPEMAAPEAAPAEISTHNVAASDVAAALPSTAARQPAGPSPVLIVAAVAGGLALTALVAFLLISRFSGGCSATVRIASPQTGSTIRGPVAIRVQADETKCIERVIYQLDGVEFASADIPPYDAILDPAQIAGLSGGNHILSVTVEDEDGNQQLQQETVLLAFNTGDTAPAAGASPAVQQQVDQPQTTGITLPAGAVDIRSMSERLSGQVTRKSGYVFDRDFVDLIRVRTNEYRVGGYSERARRYRREINKAFRDQGLDPLLGYVLALSRSKFNENAAGSGIGLWQMPLSVAQAQGYLGTGETESALKDPKRSAEIAAAYTKALLNTFESTDDFMYAVACFGMPLSQVGQVRTQLATTAPDPVARRDFMKVVKLGVVKGEQVDRVVRFFAAGVVGENPQSFGLNSDQPFSSLF